MDRWIVTPFFLEEPEPALIGVCPADVAINDVEIVQRSPPEHIERPRNRSDERAAGPPAAGVERLRSASADRRVGRRPGGGRQGRRAARPTNWPRARSVGKVIGPTVPESRAR